MRPDDFSQLVDRNRRRRVGVDMAAMSASPLASTSAGFLVPLRWRPVVGDTAAHEV